VDEVVPSQLARGLFGVGEAGVVSGATRGEAERSDRAGIRKNGAWIRKNGAGIRKNGARLGARRIGERE
jgi:hypothetical protein